MNHYLLQTVSYAFWLFIKLSVMTWLAANSTWYSWGDSTILYVNTGKTQRSAHNGLFYRVRTCVCVRVCVSERRPCFVKSWSTHEQSRGHSHLSVCGAPGEDCGGQLLAQVTWTQISVWRETSLSPVVPPKAMEELPDQPEPEQLLLERHCTKHWKENKEMKERENTSVQLARDFEPG